MMGHEHALAAELAGAAWRISSHSGASSSCVALAPLGDGRVAVRNSNHPDDGLVVFTRAELAAFVAGVKDGEFDDLTA
jgi:hypothetical protein